MKSNGNNTCGHIELFHRASHLLSSSRTLDDVLHELVGIAVQVTRCDACLVYLAEPGTGEMVLRASQLPHEGDIGNVRMKAGEGVTGWVAEHKSVVALARNAKADARFKQFSSLAEDTYEAFLSVPLVSFGQVVGVLNAHHREAHIHTPDEIALLSFIGEHMGAATALSRLATENTRLAEKAANMERQLEIRKLIERAKGILQQRYSLSEQDAYKRMRNESRRTRRPLREVAEAILLVDALGSTEGELQDA